MNIRELINELEYLNYPRELKDAQEIADYIISHSDYDIDEEFVRERFWGTKAVLKKVSIHDLKQGDEDHHIRDAEKEDRYFTMPHETVPPLVVEDGEIIDGNHRYRVAFERNQPEIYIYDVVEI